ncbi:MAG: molecular chaperone [Candidatus Methylomirabilales bacterium]
MEQAGYQKVTNDDGQETLDVADLARFRQAAYRLFSTMLLYPDEKRLKTVTTVAGELEKQADFLATFSFFIQWKELLDVLQNLGGLKSATVQEQYVQIFMVNPEYAPCLPYESAYAEEGSNPGWTAVMLEREYAAAGLSLAASLREAPDHAAVEFEFMAFLCNQEASAWEATRLNEGVTALKRQTTFLEQHLSRWLPALAKRVSGKDPSGLYATVTRAAEAFIAHDRGLVEALVERFESPTVGLLADSVS